MSKQNTIALRMVTILFCLLSITSVLAQERVLLTGEQPADTLYEVRQTQTVSVHARSLEPEGTLDTVVYVLAADGTALAFNDDAGGTSDSHIAHVTLPPGVYTVRVNSFNGVSAGQVALSIEPVDIFEAQVETQDGQTRISAALPRFAVYRYRFDGRANARVSITVRDTSGTLDPVLALKQADGRLLARNDDHNSASLLLNVLDSQISDFALPHTGEYILEVVDFLGAAGTFELLLLLESDVTQ